MGLSGLRHAPRQSHLHVSQSILFLPSALLSLSLILSNHRETTSSLHTDYKPCSLYGQFTGAPRKPGELPTLAICLIRAKMSTNS